MNWIKAFRAMQEKLGNDAAFAVAEYLDTQSQKGESRPQAVAPVPQQEMNQMEFRFIDQLAKLHEDHKREMANLIAQHAMEDARTRKAFNLRLNWLIVIQLIILLIVALAAAGLFISK